MDFKSHSQAGQDVFVNYVLQKDNGTFLDVESGHPMKMSNTYELETKKGWRGLLIDGNKEFRDITQKERKSPFICADPRMIDWKTTLNEHFPGNFKMDYLSFDLGDKLLAVFPKIPLETVRFRVLTIEHEAYRFGDFARGPIRQRLRGLGYDLICSNVKNDGFPFEDWWVDPREVNMERVERLRCDGKEWQEIITLL